MKIALAQLNFRIGDLLENDKKIKKAIMDAQQQGAELIVFSEMAIGGYPAKDLWFSNDFIQKCQFFLDELVSFCKELKIACIIGLPTFNAQSKGKRLHNSAAFIQDGQILDLVNKSLIPDYDVFDEYRYFEPSSKQVHLVQFGNTKIALTICEDLWEVHPPFLYSNAPMDILRLQEPDLLINIAASPFSIGQFELRRDILSHQAKQAHAPLLYVNQVGAQADLIFDGTSMIFDQNGELMDVLPSFKEEIRLVEIDHANKIINSIAKNRDFSDGREEIQSVYDALTFGIKDYFEKMGFKSAVLGLSGGLDSALVLALAVKALGPDNVLAVLMPSRFSSEHSVKDSLDLVKNLQCPHQIIPIHDCVDAFDKSLLEVFAGKSTDLTEENIQARVRGTLLMAVSNKFGHILLNTSNKSEAAVGYGTLYGDMAGSLSVIGDLFKTDAYRLAYFINKDQEIIPHHILVKAPSAELRPDQKDSDSLPDYAVLDQILRLYIEEEKDESMIIQQGFEAELVRKTIRLVDNAEFKRFQSPPVLRISKKSFGSGRSFSLVYRKNYS